MMNSCLMLLQSWKEVAICIKTVTISTFVIVVCVYIRSHILYFWSPVLYIPRSEGKLEVLNNMRDFPLLSYKGISLISIVSKLFKCIQLSILSFRNSLALAVNDVAFHWHLFRNRTSPVLKSYLKCRELTIISTLRCIALFMPLCYLPNVHP